MFFTPFSVIFTVFAAPLSGSDTPFESAAQGGSAQPPLGTPLLKMVLTSGYEVLANFYSGRYLTPNLPIDRPPSTLISTLSSTSTIIRAS